MLTHIYSGYYWKRKDGIIYRVWYDSNNPLVEHYWEVWRVEF